MAMSQPRANFVKGTEWDEFYWYYPLIKEVYVKHRPDKLTDLNELFSQNRGKERDLYLRICQKYNVVPKAIEETEPSPAATEAAQPPSKKMEPEPGPVAEMAAQPTPERTRSATPQSRGRRTKGVEIPPPADLDAEPSRKLPTDKEQLERFKALQQLRTTIGNSEVKCQFFQLSPPSSPRRVPVRLAWADCDANKLPSAEEERAMVDVWKAQPAPQPAPSTAPSLPMGAADIALAHGQGCPGPPLKDGEAKAHQEGEDAATIALAHGQGCPGPPSEAGDESSGEADARQGDTKALSEEAADKGDTTVMQEELDDSESDGASENDSATPTSEAIFCNHVEEVSTLLNKLEWCQMDMCLLKPSEDGSWEISPARDIDENQEMHCMEIMDKQAPKIRARISNRYGLEQSRMRIAVWGNEGCEVLNPKNASTHFGVPFMLLGGTPPPRKQGKAKACRKGKG